MNGKLVANLDMQFDLKAALKRALGGGLSGAAAMVLQVLLLMVGIPSLRLFQPELNVM